MKSLRLNSLTGKFCKTFKIPFLTFSETCVAGTARFMNTWLVSKPDESEITEYFDDRIFNRNYDDWNDLLGLFGVKQGIPTLGKTVTAETYVYSDRRKSVCWQFAGSGVYTLFCNGKTVGAQKKAPDDVRKSGVKYLVKLNKGWNKLTVKIKHVNPNKECNLFGFYSRLCNSFGNTVSGLTYSVDGPSESLKISTRGILLDKDEFYERNKNCPANSYFDNELPIAYEKNPYVWFKAKVGTATWKCQASHFMFQAGGGRPPYKFTLENGKLPEGLVLLNDGTVDGFVAEKTAGEYHFTLKATDKNGKTVLKNFTMTVKENPVQWFEQGRMAALSHCTGTIPNLYDPNYSFDEWAKTAKEMGLTMLSTETYQNTLYYWQSPNADLTPDDSNPQFKYNTMQKVNGEWEIIDRVGQAKKAAERQGLHFGVYLSPQRPQSDIQGLVVKYDPWYIFLDGNPQTGVNLDIAFSSARNYNDRVLFVTNPFVEVADQDITLMERGFWNSEPYNEKDWKNNILPEGKYVAHEEWNDPYCTAHDLWKVWSPNGNQMRDNWRYATMELIDTIGHGFVMNYDSSITAARDGDSYMWEGRICTEIDKDNVYMMTPVHSQQFSDMRHAIADWITNKKGCDLHESLFGTMPYYIEYSRKDDWGEKGTQQAFFHGEGPEWGYALSRDENVYLHMIENQIQGGRAKSGFKNEKRLKNIGPFKYEIESVLWMNENETLSFETIKREDGYYIDIDTSSVSADPIDTVIKVVTRNPEKTYKPTGIKMLSSRLSDDKLQLKTECYLNNYVSFSASSKLKYTSSDTSVAAVSDDGVVTAKSDGNALIAVRADYYDKLLTETYPVIVKNGRISPVYTLVGVGMLTNGKAFWNQVSANTKSSVTFIGHTDKGETVDLLCDDIVYHYGKIDASTKNPTKKIAITETNEKLPIVIEDGVLKVSSDKADKYYCYWADVTVNGETFTSSRNFVTVIPDRNVAEGNVPEVSSNCENAHALSDGVINDSTGGNFLKWTPDDNSPTVTYDLGKAYDLTRVNIFFNMHMPSFDAVTYYNVPKKIIIEYSSDGENFAVGNTLSELTGKVFPDNTENRQIPTADETPYAWEAENLFYNYPVDCKKESVNARFVRISFPEGGQNGKNIDILEIKIYAKETIC